MLIAMIAMAATFSACGSDDEEQDEPEMSEQRDRLSNTSWGGRFSDEDCYVTFNFKSGGKVIETVDYDDEDDLEEARGTYTLDGNNLTITTYSSLSYNCYGGEFIIASLTSSQMVLEDMWGHTCAVLNKK